MTKELEAYEKMSENQRNKYVEALVKKQLTKQFNSFTSFGIFKTYKAIYWFLNLYDEAEKYNIAERYTLKYIIGAPIVYRISKDKFNKYNTKELKELYNAIINICKFSKSCRLFDIKSNYRVNSQEMLNIGAVVANNGKMNDEEFNNHVIIKQLENEDDLKKTIKTRLLKRDMLGINEFVLDLGIAYMVASSETSRVELFIGVEETR